MSDPTPPGNSSPLLGFVALGTFIVGLLVATAFHEVADLRPYVPPIFAKSATLACGDIDAYVLHVKNLNDHHVRIDTFGIHRQKTIDAVNELYDRARCDAHQDDYGHETYKTLSAKVLVDSNDPPPATSALAASVPTSPAPVAAPATGAPRPVVTTRHPRVRIVNDGTLDAMPAPEPPAPNCPPPVHPHQVYYGPIRGCPDYIRLPN